MAIRVAGLSVPGPSEVLGAAQSAALTAVGWSARAVDVAAGLPERLSTVLDDVDQLVKKITSVVDRADELVQRADGIIDGAEHTVMQARAVTETATAIVGRADGVTTAAVAVVDDSAALAARAATVVDGASQATSEAMEIVEICKPLAEKAAPLAKRFVEELTEEEVQAAIKLIDHLPTITEAIERDVIPILATLDRVGPDVHELLDVLKEVRHAITGIPGFRFFRKRGEEAEAEEREEAAADRS